MKRRARGMSVYANLSAQRKSRADAKARKKAEYLATLPKDPVKRLLYRLHPKRVFKYWFSKKGAMMALKLAGIGVVIMVIFIAALFAYYRRELDALSPGEISKRVQTTVTKYYDRNNVLLWEDKGSSDYRLVVDSKDISTIMKQATVAIEDKDFYKHGGISISGIIRASINNLTSGDTQGASTLTQQLVKQVFFADDAEKNRLSVSRKIKEAILAIEVERMYNKDQILSLYLNEVSYGGRRNGVESAAQTYFGKPAKDLTLAEASLLASIPQNPSYYNPYYIEGNKALLARQRAVLDSMAEQGYITKAQADDAKKVAVLDTVKPELAADENIKAPHFVLAVRNQLESEFGQRLIRSGGLTIKTTLDYRMQQIAEKAVTDAYNTQLARGQTGADNIAFSSVDVQTGQIVAMVGSYDYGNKTYGEQNAATSLLQPGSSIKPFDYSELFKQRQGQNYGAGSILADEDISSFYKSKLGNADGKFFGAISIRDALGNSRNPPAVKAAYIAGIDNVVKLARDMGDHSYCINEDYGLSAAIGGCRVRLIEHVNAYASIARAGVYKKESYVLEVKNAQGQSIKQWKDESKRVLDPQVTYIISDILADAKARSRVFGLNYRGAVVPGVKTATKTGTTDNGNNQAKDGWMMSYTPAIAAGVWVGRHDGGALKTSIATAPGYVIDAYMSRVHKEVLQPENKWKTNDWFTKPAGVQSVAVNGKTDIYPSWFTKPQNSAGTKLTFDKVSKKKATNCTPDQAKIEITVQVIEDPVTKKKTYGGADGYDPNADDSVHKCDDAKPFASLTTTPMGSGMYKISVTANQGSFALQTLEIRVNGALVSSQPISAAGTYTTDHTFTAAGDANVSATVIDAGYYDATVTKTVTVTLATENPRGRRGNGPIGLFEP